MRPLENLDCPNKDMFYFFPQLLARIERMERRMQLVRKDSEKDKQRTSQSREPAADMPEGPLPESAGGGEFPPEASPQLPGLTPKPFSYGRNAKGHKRLVKVDDVPAIFLPQRYTVTGHW